MSRDFAASNSETGVSIDSKADNYNNQRSIYEILGNIFFNVKCTQFDMVSNNYYNNDGVQKT